ncbi:hypothetical protein ID866_5214 [Astraeus odoratus]|nr:hypothetical protein ID866_5214 [Astraeus odoratus]
MPPKRKGEESKDLNGRDRKKLKMADARTIAVQPTVHSSSGQGDRQANAAPGPSKTVVNFDTSQGLPSSIDVERFTEARAYEISAMQSAIKAAGDSSTHRAWQTLPRHLRRRAASHDVRRVPLRLREKARAEASCFSNGAIQTTHPTADGSCDKTWLETHIWHAKRAKMENMWGYRLAVTPTEKAFRPSHRASVHGSILHDASYYATIEIQGPQTILLATLEACCDPQGPGLKQCMSGSRACDTHIYEHARWPFGLVGPITIIWQSVSPNDASSSSGEAQVSIQRSHKGKEKEIIDNGMAEPDPLRRTRIIWVRAHPAVFEDVLRALEASASHAIQADKQKNPTLTSKIEIIDLRGSLNAFEIMGPKSTQVIRGALSLAGGEEREDFKKFWETLSDLQTPANIPRRMIVGFKVLDPRLKFPPKNATSSYPDPSKPPAVSSSNLVFPSSVTAQTELWDEDKRDRLKKPRFKKKDLDERRSKLLVPGTKLNPLRQDDRVPVMLIQRSLESCPPSSRSTYSFDDSRGIHGWTLLFPAGWSMAFLSSLIYTGTRFAGQRERMKQYFEAGTPAFPMDYPSTRAYEIAVEERAEKEKEKWEKTPPAKRASWGKLGTRSPWRADWNVVLGLEKPPLTNAAQGLVTTQRDAHANMSIPEDATAVVLHPWLLRGSKVPSILSNVCITPSEFLNEINKLREKYHMSLLDKAVLAEDLWRSALVMIRIKMVGRGAPGELANIYKMDDIEARKWLKATTQKTSGTYEDAEVPTERELAEMKPAQEDIVGYVTTGDVSLARGEGFALGAIPVVQYIALRKQAQRLARPAIIVKIRERDTTVSRAAYVELLDG